MSAFDLAGTVASLIITALSIISIFTGAARNRPGNAWMAIMGAAWFAFCIARLSGAHL